jgi:hypothetical protein
MSQATCCWCDSPLVRSDDVWLCGNLSSDACRTRQARFSVEAVDNKSKRRVLLYVPTPKQTVWHEAVYERGLNRILVGGAAGPGKSKWLRETLYRFANEVPGFHALLLRKTHKDLEQSHLRFMSHEVKQRGGDYTKGPPAVATFYHKGQADSVIRCGHLEDSGAIENYLSSEYDAIAPDELVTFDRDPMLELFSRARSTNKALFALRGLSDPDPEQELDGSLVVTATNPGGRGALWVKDFFVDHNPDPAEFPNYEPQKWAFFDARLHDNPYIKAGYRKTLLDMREARRRQLLDGDWNVFEGAFFSEWRDARHLRRIEFDFSSVEWFCSLDWGFNAPFACYWWACMPDGHYYIRREWKDKGLNAEEFSKGFWKITREEMGLKRVRYVVADPSIKNNTGAGRGETVLETLRRYGLPMRGGDNDRTNGWYRVHELLRDAPDGMPWLVVDPSCTYLARSLPALMQDKNDPDDVDTHGDDHGADSVRYGAMSRPSPTRAKSAEPYPVNSLGWMRQQHEQRKGVLA